MGNTVIEKSTPSVTLGAVTSGGSATKSQEAAQKIIDAATTEGVFWGTDVDTAQMAEEIVAMRRTNPDQAFTVEAEIARINPDAGFQSRLYEDIRIISEYAGLANDRLQTLGPDGATPTGAITERAQLSGPVDRLLADATSPIGRNRGGVVGGDLNVAKLAYQVETLAADDPQLSQVLRAELTDRLSPADAAKFNRILAGSVGVGESIGLALSHPGDGVIGAGKGFANGFITLGDYAARGVMWVGAGAQQASAIALEEGASLAQPYVGLYVDINLAETIRPYTDGLNNGADILYDVAGQPILPLIPYANSAQSGGANAEAAVELVTGIKGAVTLGVRVGSRILGREAAEAAARQADEVAVSTSVSGASPETIVRLAEQQSEVISRLAGKLDKAITSIVGRVDAISAGLARREIEIPPTAERLGMSSSDFRAIIDLPKSNRPDPSNYISEEMIGRHLDMFETEGAVRITSNRYETLARGDVGYVIPKSEYDALIAQTSGNKGELEEILGLRHGRLSDGDTIIAWIKPDDMQGLRMPSGNEPGTNYLWLPGGLTLNGVPEAILDLPKDTPFIELTISE